MKKILAFILVCLSLLLCSCGYSESDMKRIRQEAYDEGFLAGTGSSDDSYSYGHDEGYEEGYADGWDDAVHEMKERAKDEDPPFDFARYVQNQLEYAFDYLADYGYYNDEEYVKILNEIYRECDKQMKANVDVGKRQQPSTADTDEFNLF